MAYDSHAEYVPPIRPLNNRVQPTATSSSYQGAQYNNYQSAETYDQEYNNGYQAHHAPQTYSRTPASYHANQSQPPQGDYRSARSESYVGSNGYPDAQDRVYDQRYQRRENGSAYDPNTGRSQYSPERRPQITMNQSFQYANGQRNAMQNDQHLNTYSNSSGFTGRPGDHYSRPRGDMTAMQQPHSDPRAASKTTSMDDWQAREKSRMHRDQTPGTVAQDNAFPVFPNGNGREDRGSNSGSRPSTSSNTTDHYQANMRQKMPRQNSHERDDKFHNPANGRQSFEQNGMYSANSRARTYDDRPQAHGPAHDSQGGYHHDNSHNGPYGRPLPRSRPSQDNSLRDGSRQGDYRNQNSFGAPMLQDRSMSASPAMNQTRTYGTESYTSYNQAPQHLQRPAVAEYGYDHVGTKPNNSIRNGSEAPYGQAIDQPSFSGQMHSSPPRMVSSPVAFATSDPYSNPNSQSLGNQLASDDMRPAPLAASNRSSLGDFYDNYHTDPINSQPAPTQSREQQIESEMPNFDSAAPHQTSRSQKGSVPGQIPPGLQSTSTQSLPNPPLRPHQETLQQDGSVSRYQSPLNTSRPGQSIAPNGQSAPNFSVPSPAYGQQSLNEALQQPPQPPFANESAVRRSMDDTRQMPIRQGPPPPQRFYNNGPSPNMGGPQGHPGDQQPRVGSAPPGQAVGREPLGPSPPNVPNGRRQVPFQEDDQFNPDALPHHPMPVRPGLDGKGSSQPKRPPPVRNYDSAPTSVPSQQGPRRSQEQGANNGSEHRRQASTTVEPQPVTHAEIERLRAVVSGNPNNPKPALVLAKKLAEAARVLANEGGRVDARTAAKNREKYINEAYKRVKKLVANGYPEAQFYLADCYGSGELGLEVDSKEAFGLYQTAAKQGHPQAAYRTAVCCEIGADDGGGTRKDYGKAVQWYRRASALGDVAAMYKLGIIQLRGMLGQPRNVGEALNWLKRSAERADADNPHALHELATLYESGNRDPEIRNKLVADDAYAHELYHQAAKLDFKTSQFRLGQAYEYGQLGLAIDNRASIAWYSKAAAQGEHQAELALSGWYLTGAEGILEQSDTEAYLWARKAASSEPPQPKAMFAMGYFSEQGIGCPANVDEARRWYGRAASYKFPKALERLEELKRSSKGKLAPVAGRLGRKDQKKDESECTIM